MDLLEKIKKEHSYLKEAKQKLNEITSLLEKAEKAVKKEDLEKSSSKKDFKIIRKKSGTERIYEGIFIDLEELENGINFFIDHYEDLF